MCVTCYYSENILISPIFDDSLAKMITEIKQAGIKQKYTLDKMLKSYYIWTKIAL